MTRVPLPYQPFSSETADSRGHPVIVLEGVSGIGKSTLASLLAARLQGFSLHTLTSPHTDWAPVISELRPLPQLGFYLSGLLHASDRIRQEQAHGPVVADRYQSSVIACHAAVHHVPTDAVTALLAPFRSYLVAPTRTYYLHCSPDTLQRRMATKKVLARDDTDLLTIPTRLPQLMANFAEVAQTDTSAVRLDTDGKSPDELADWVLNDLEHPRA
ncbi:dTMP kinase [Streptomyces sp. NPDC059445]|uniref:dTMP kinase n=1 Tax=Streptomyces sp. NPDC059445 TaxID=3346832 RepID=UPI00368FFDF2